ncbi:MAG: NAD(P)H-dependent oxidoreductase subunit E [Christensenellales bacterium]
MDHAVEKEYFISPSAEKRIMEIAQRYKKEPHQLMNILLDIQKETANAFPHSAAALVSRVTGIPEADLYGFVSFYAMFSTEPRGAYVVRMCHSAPCHVCGAKGVMEAISKTLGILPGETSKDGKFTLEYCQCLGVCDHAPAIMVNETVYRNLTPGRAATLMEDYQRGDVN